MILRVRKSLRPSRKQRHINAAQYIAEVDHTGGYPRPSRAHPPEEVGGRQRRPVAIRSCAGPAQRVGSMPALVKAAAHDGVLTEQSAEEPATLL